jgi:hypothetical protein
LARGEQPGRAPLTDSPWFWAYLFGTAALVALFLAGPRYHDRQGELEREFSARQSSGQVVVGRDGPVTPAAGPTIISLRPLTALLAVVWTIAWTGLWFQRFRRRAVPIPSSPGAPRYTAQGNVGGTP